MRRAASEPPIGSPAAICTQAGTAAPVPAATAVPAPVQAPIPAPVFPSLPIPTPTVPYNPYVLPYDPGAFSHPQYQFMVGPYPHHPSFPLPTALNNRQHHSPEPEEMPTKYPLITDWLVKLDSGPRSDGQNFARFGECLNQNGYMRLYQLAEESRQDNGAKDLVELCPGMTLGLAKLLLKYAAKDCRDIH